MIGPKRPLCDAALVAQMQEVAAHLRLTEIAGRAVIVGGKAENAADVGGLGVRREAGRDHVVDHTLTQGCHRSGPSRGWHRHMPAPRDYPASPATHLTASATYGDAVQSNVFYVMPIAHPASVAISQGNRVFGVTLSTAAGWRPQRTECDLQQRREGDAE